MKNILVKIFKWIFSDFTHLLFVISIIGLIVFMFKYNSLKKSYDDMIAQTEDSITSYKNKVGDLYVKENTYIMDIKDLKKRNSELNNEVKSLKDHPVVVTKIKTDVTFKDKVIHDTVTVDSGGRYTFNMNYNDQWCKIAGKSTFDKKLMVGEAHFDSIVFPNNITVDLIDRKGDLSFIAKSDNPYCQINSLNGSILSPESSKAFKKRFEKNWYVVYGVGPTISVYDNKIIVVPGLQVTFGRKLFAF